jgi:hypothetical protein
MVVTVVLRLLKDPLESGQLVGHVEHVATGASEPVRGIADIVAFCQQAAGPSVVVEEAPSMPAQLATGEASAG